MKKKFSSIPTRTVTFYRGAESIDFDLTALPIGYREHLTATFPPPVEYIDGAAHEKDDPEYWSLYGYLVLAKALEPSGLLDIAPASRGGNRAEHERYARAVREEFVEANITEGEVGELLTVLAGLDKAQQKPEQRKVVGNG